MVFLHIPRKDKNCSGWLQYIQLSKPRSGAQRARAELSFPDWIEVGRECMEHVEVSEVIGVIGVPPVIIYLQMDFPLQTIHFWGTQKWLWKPKFVSPVGWLLMIQM